MPDLGGLAVPTIPGFQYVRVLGYGGFSEVYLYKQKLPRRSVAIKVLHVDALDIQSRKQFVAEANLMAQVSSHPAIATIYSAGISDDNQPYFVMEHCSGGSLNPSYRNKPMSIADVLRTGVRVASALESAHRVGIFHRDVKPANILITDYGLPVLTDFGISIGDDGIAESTMFQGDHLAGTTATGTGSQVMSIPWAPPEALGDVPIGNARSDIYSLGATLFSLLEGRSPFEVPGASNKPADFRRRIEQGELNPITRAGVPDRLLGLIAQSMARDPSRRPPSAGKVAEALQAVEIELGLPATPIEVRQTGLDADPTDGAAPATPPPSAAIAGRGQPVWNLDASTASPMIHGSASAPNTGRTSDQLPTSPAYVPLEYAPLRPPRSRAPFIVIGAALLAIAAGIAAVAIVPGLVVPTSTTSSDPSGPSQILEQARTALEQFAQGNGGSYDATWSDLTALGYTPGPEVTTTDVHLGQFGADASPYCITVVLNGDGTSPFSILQSGPAVKGMCPPPAGEQPRNP